MATQPVPSADQFFGTAATSQQQNLPTADQFFGAPEPHGGSANDTIWSSAKSAGARILNAFGYGAAQGWGSEPIGLAPDTEKFFRDTGLFRDYEAGHQSFLNSFSNVAIRPVTEGAIRAGAAALETVQRAGSAVIGAIGSASEAAAQEIQGSGGSTLRTAAALPFGALSEGAGYLATGGIPEVGMPVLERGFAARSATEATEGESIIAANQARAAGVVGEGEAGFYEAVPPTETDIQARTNAAAEAGMDQAPLAMPPAPDIHALARRVDPETFDRYDALAAEREDVRDQIARLQEERSRSPEAEAARGEIADLLGVEHEEPIQAIIDRETAFRASASEDQVKRLDSAMDRLEAALSTDTPEQATLRNRLNGVNFEIRDMAPQVTEAYRNAADMLPEGALEQAAQPEKGLAIPGSPEWVKQQQEQRGAPNQPERIIPAAAGDEVARTIAPPNVLGGETLGEPGGNSVSGGKEGENQFSPAAEGAAKPAGRPVTTNMKSIEGTGELKTRSLSEGVEAKAIEDGLTDTFGDLPEYRSLSMAEQAEGVSKLIAEDYERARAIAMGERQPPKGLLPESVFVGVEKHALATGDVETLRQLGTKSRLATAATTMGQRIRALGERDKASPVGAIADVQAAREAALKAKNIDIEAEKANIASEIKAEMKKAATVKQDAWADFVAAIKCGEA